MSDTSIRVVGIDPGQHTGIVCIELPIFARDFRRAAWVGSSSVIRHSARKGETFAESEQRHFSDLYDVLERFSAELIVIERPSDAMVGGWNKAKGGKPEAIAMQGRHVAFSLGAAYGLVCAAAGCCDATRRTFSYQVAGSKDQPGWMPKEKTGNFTHTMKGERLVALLRYEIEQYFPRRGLAYGADSLDDDELKAFGVLRYHITEHGAE